MVETYKNLKVGDSVFVINRCGKKLSTIEKVTPKGFLKVDGILFDHNGRQRGADPWFSNRIAVAAEWEITEYTKQKFVEKVIAKMKRVEDLRFEDAVAIHKILDVGGE